MTCGTGQYDCAPRYDKSVQMSSLEGALYNQLHQEAVAGYATLGKMYLDKAYSSLTKYV